MCRICSTADTSSEEKKISKISLTIKITTAKSLEEKGVGKNRSIEIYGKKIKSSKV
jgi:hypothetical protein